MAQNDDARDSGPEDSAPDRAISRRQILTSGLAAAGAGLAPIKAATPDDSSTYGPTSGSDVGATTEFRARFSQTGPAGEHFIAYGYLTAASGLTDDDLFAGLPLSDATALVTAYAVGELARRTVDQSVHSLDIEGSLTVYQRSLPGASFDDPDSFHVGTPVARFDITLQDIVTVFAPGKGLPTLTGYLRQTFAAHLDGPGRRRTFGQKGAEARLFATGIGTLLNPETFNSALEMAGSWTSR
jgi:hypothetical protein